VERLTEPAVQPGDPLPVALGEPVVTVYGRIRLGDGERGLRLDLDALDAMGVVELSVTDPWLGERVAYSGVLVRDLLAYVGADTEATGIRVVAMDEYVAYIPMGTLYEYPILLATRAEGETMDIASGGPSHIVFPYDDYPSLAEARNLSVWNVARIYVK